MVQLPSQDWKPMELVQSIDATKLKREKSNEAIQLALAGQWRNAILVNQEILYYFPQDIEALNRLGKAYLEVGEHAEARQSFEKVLSLSSHNTIAKRNLDRLSHLQETTPVSQTSRKTTSHLFLEESGKSGITFLRNPAPQPVLAKVAAGDPVNLKLHNNTLVVEDLDGDTLGYVEPRLGSRLVRLMQQGNSYSGVVLSASYDKISIIIRETYRHPNLMGVSSFPTKVRDQYRGYLRDTLLRYDIESEPEEESEEEPLTTWTEDGEEAPQPLLRSPGSGSHTAVEDDADEDD